MILYANADKTRIVPANDPDARYVVNTDHPEGFEVALADFKAQAQTKAQKPAENKAQAPAGQK